MSADSKRGFMACPGCGLSLRHELQEVCDACEERDVEMYGPDDSDDDLGCELCGTYIDAPGTCDCRDAER